MQASEPIRRPSLDPEVAVSLLDRQTTASDRLRSIFAEAGRLVVENMPNQRLLSTRLLLFAAVELGGRDESDSDDEGRALNVFSALLRRDAGRFEELRRAYFQPGSNRQEPDRDRFATLSANTFRLLRDANWKRRSRRQQQGANIDTADAYVRGLDAIDLILGLPAPGNGSADLLHALGVSAEDLDRSIAEFTANVTPPQPTPEPKPTPRRRRRGETRFDERVSAHTDEPATADQLGRRSFAQVLALRIEQARMANAQRKAKEEQDHKARGRGRTQRANDAAFIVHLHGPWGSGKSSVLNFLRVELEERTSRWVVVEFNAWRDQRLQPPWWTLITSIYLGARSQLGWRKLPLFLRWQLWRARADYFPIVGVVFLAFLILGLLGFGYERLANTAVEGGKAGGAFDTWLKMATFAMSSLTIVGAMYVGFRTLALGSRRAAQAYADLKADPYRPIASLFEKLVGAIRRPVAVFIDDLDRCDAAYVVSLLEGIQTLMRGAAVTYVVAADRKWICSSFEQHYAGFTEPIGEPGRPLGYLFLDKMFQISVPLPAPSPEARSSYWRGLLKASPQMHREHETRLLQAERQAETETASLTRPEDMQAYLAQAERSNDPVKLPAARAAVAKRITSQEALEALEHRLEAFAPVVEPNPRAMKRLVNAYAMHQSTLFLSGSNTIFNTLVRWTILELRWPMLADFLAARPECIDALREPLAKDEMPHVPDGLRRLFGDSWVIRVLGPKSATDRLNTGALKKILGAVQGDR